MAWERVHVFLADERAVPPDHPDSNFGLAGELLPSRVPLPEWHIHRMAGEAEDLEAAAANYEVESARACREIAAHGVPVIDLVLLGLGSDGHTASLFPGTAALAETARGVVPNHVPELNT
jgi:6-phosphogluconolactonase